MNISLILLLLLFCGCNNECEEKEPCTVLTPPCAPSKPVCPRRESFERERNTRQEENGYNVSNTIFSPFNNSTTCSCGEK